MLKMMLTLQLASVAVAAPGPDYCSVSSCAPGHEHTMCRFNTSGAAPDCDPVWARGVSDAERATILAVHNQLRAAVRRGEFASHGLPAAAALPPLRWDAELAELAQRWADQCGDDERDLCRDVPRFQVGQNVAWIYDQQTNWGAAVEDCFFYDQLDSFGQTQENLTYVAQPDYDGDTSRLSQLLWAATTELGCGYIAVADDADSSGDEEDDFAVHTYICNYGPAGNIPDAVIYTKA